MAWRGGIERATNCGLHMLAVFVLGGGGGRPELAMQMQRKRGERSSAMMVKDQPKWTMLALEDG